MKNSASWAFQQTPIKHHRIVIAYVGLQLLLDGTRKLEKTNEVIRVILAKIMCSSRPCSTAIALPAVGLVSASGPD